MASIFKSPATGFAFATLTDGFGVAAAICAKANAEMSLAQPDRQETYACEAVVSVAESIARLKTFSSADPGGELTNAYWVADNVKKGLSPALPSRFVQCAGNWADEVSAARQFGPAPLGEAAQFGAFNASYAGNATERATRCAFMLAGAVMKGVTNPSGMDSFFKGIYAEMGKTGMRFEPVEAHWHFVSLGGRVPQDDQELAAFTAAIQVNVELARRIAKGVLRQPLQLVG